MQINDLKKGTIVRAIRDLDPVGANVHQGDLGVVKAEAGAYEDDNGPMVRWFRVADGLPQFHVSTAGICNVYEGDVEVIELPD